MKKNDAGIFLLLGALLFLIYYPTFSAEFLPWDDDYNIFINPHFAASEWLIFWQKPYYGLYIPLTSMVWGVLYQLGEASSFAFRAFNWILHFLNCFLLFWFLQTWFDRLQLRQKWPLYLALAIFAFHPLQVESIAWISAGRDLLSTTLALFCLLAYFRWSGWKGFAIAGFFFVLALLTKPQVASLPAVIFILSLLTHSQSWRKTFAQMAVWTLPVIALVSLTFREQKEYVAKTIDFAHRLLVIFDSYGFYLEKIFWPTSFSVDYGRTPEKLISQYSTLWLPSFLFASVAILFITLWWRKTDRRAPLLFLCWMATLAPVSGVIDFAYQDISTTADRYAYFPMIFFGLLLAYGLNRLPNIGRPLWMSSLTGITVLLSILSWQRMQIWLTPQDFFSNMIEGNPKSYSAHIGLGGAWVEQGDNEKALQFYQKALELKPNDAIAMANIFASHFRMQRYATVMNLESYLLKPNFLHAYLTRHVAASKILSALGASAYSLGDLKLSLLYMCQAHVADPRNSNIEKAKDQVLLTLKNKNMPSECPTFATDEDFFRTVNSSLSERGHPAQ